MSSPSIAYGTANTTLSGDISLRPTETISITLDNVTQLVMVENGAFSSTFSTAALDVPGSPYAITYTYFGDANYAESRERNPHRDQGHAGVQFLERSDRRLRCGDGDAFGRDLAGAQRGDGFDHAGQRDANGDGENGAFSSTFNTAALDVADSPYTITYSYAGGVDLNAISDGSETFTVARATPAFSGLVHPTIVYGTSSTTLSGSISSASMGRQFP